MSIQYEMVRKYLQLLETFELDADKFSGLFHDEFKQKEFPNQLNTTGQESDLSNLFERMKIGRQILQTQRFDIISHIEEEGRLMIEANWHGQMALDARTFKKDQLLRAHFCMVFEFRDHKLFRQRNYDCFESFD